LQLRGKPTQVPPEQASFVVQALPSLQAAVLGVCVQPIAGSHASVVQTLPSSQFGAAPPTQTPPEQTSLAVQAFPSLHGLVLLMWTQPLAGLHESFVQGLLSLQLTVVPLQTPPEHTSPLVQALPSLQEFVLLACWQPVAGVHESVVHTFPSSQLIGEPSLL
jgi:hypothetical protein